MCQLLPFFGNKIDQKITLTSFGLASMIAYMIEPPVRHTQLMAFIMPKAIETFFNMLAKKKSYKRSPWHKILLALVAWAFLGYSFLLETERKRALEKSARSQAVAETNFGRLGEPFPSSLNINIGADLQDYATSDDNKDKEEEIEPQAKSLGANLFTGIAGLIVNL